MGSGVGLPTEARCRRQTDAGVGAKRTVYRGVAVSLVLYEQQGRDLDMRACLAEISVGQFTAVEGRLDRYFATRQSAEDFSAALRVDNQQMWTAYQIAPLHELPEAQRVALAVVGAAERAKARDIGFMGVSLTPEPEPAPRTDEQLRFLSERLEELGASLGRRALYLGLHNDEALSRDNARELRYLLQHTTPQNVGLCADVAWLVRCGVNAAQFLTEFKDRLRTIHVRQMRGGVWQEDFGDGEIDYRPIDRVVRPLKQDIRIIWEPTYEEGTKLTRRTVDDLKLSRQYLRRVFAQ